MAVFVIMLDVCLGPTIIPHSVSATRMLGILPKQEIGVLAKTSVTILYAPGCDAGVITNHLPNYIPRIRLVLRKHECARLPIFASNDPVRFHVIEPGP